MRLELHILRELVASFLLAAAVVYFVVVVGVVGQLAMSQGLPLLAAIRLAPLGLIAQSELLTPLAFLIGVIFTYGRFAAENEFLATQACGVHPMKVVAPVIAIGLCLAIGQGYVTSDLIPRVWVQRARFLREVGLEAFKRLDPGRTEFEAKSIGLYLSWARRDGAVLEDVKIDYRGADPEKGPLYAGHAEKVEIEFEEKAVRLRVRGFRTLFDREFQMWSSNFTLRLDLSDLTDTREFRGRPEHLTTEELVDVAIRSARRADVLESKIDRTDPVDRRRYERAREEAHLARFTLQRRVATSFCALLFGLVGVPVAVRLRRGTRLAAIVTALGIVFVLYFPFAKVGDAMADRRSVPSWVSAWLAVSVLGAVAGTLQWRFIRR